MQIPGTLWVREVFDSASMSWNWAASIKQLPGGSWRYYIPIMENQMEKKMENEMETGNI